MLTMDRQDTTRRILPGARLCKNCTSFRFDDAKFGGTACSTQDNISILKFDSSRQQRYFPIPLEIEDDLPDLPALENSAKTGCEFCGFLRGSIIRAGLEYGGRIQLQSSFAWGQPHFSRNPSGLVALIIKVWAVKVDTFVEHLRRLTTLLFNICCHERRYPLNSFNILHLTLSRRRYGINLATA